jgi:hypothetical protein
LLQKASLSAAEIRQLIDIDDRHMRGNRFDWDSFLFKRYERLKEDAVKQLKSKKAKQKFVADAIIQEQIQCPDMCREVGGGHTGGPHCIQPLLRFGSPQYG